MVASGKAVVRKLFGIKPTSGYRSPSHELSKANPGSWHSKGSASQNGAVDMQPIKGMTFQQAAQKIQAAGYTILEAIDEVNHPSGHATGPHWHFVIGKQ
jgi:hypothetical protein